MQEAQVWDDFVGFLQDNDLADDGRSTRTRRGPMTSSPSTELRAGDRRSPALEVAGLTVTFAGAGAEAATSSRSGTSTCGSAPGSSSRSSGRPGCGKSTLLRVLAGLTPAGATVDGARDDPLDGRRVTAWMPQRDGLLPWRRALPNALVGARIAGMDRAVADGAGAGAVRRVRARRVRAGVAARAVGRDAPAARAAPDLPARAGRCCCSTSRSVRSTRSPGGG